MVSVSSAVWDDTEKTPAGWENVLDSHESTYASL